MGVFASCCRDDAMDEEEPLLAGQQSGYLNGHEENDNDSALQSLKKEREMRELERINELKNIVETLNDKLIDISMISDSGIILPTNDIQEASIEENDTMIKLNVDIMSKDTKNDLKKLHKAVFPNLLDNLSNTQKEPPNLRVFL